MSVRSSEELFTCMKRAVKIRKTEETTAVIILSSRIKDHQEVMQSFRSQFYKDGMKVARLVISKEC